MSMMTYTNPLSDIREQINRLFSDFAEETRSPLLRPEQGLIGSARTMTFLPPIEVSENDKEIVISAALPGIKPENINVEMLGNSLVISGESRKESKIDEKQFHRSEFQYGQFMRRVPLPDYVKGDQCDAQYKNGVLELHLPKSQESKRKKIEIKSGK